MRSIGRMFRLYEIDIWVLTLLYHSHAYLTTLEIAHRVGITRTKPEIYQLLENSIAKLLKEGYIFATDQTPPRHHMTQKGINKYIELVAAIDRFIKEKTQL
jgi:predicted transcriptional regulator